MKKIIVFIVIAGSLLFSSCATQGYGCKGRASWNDVVRKANKLY